MCETFFFLQVVKGLHYLWGLKIIHRGKIYVFFVFSKAFLNFHVFSLVETSVIIKNLIAEKYIIPAFAISFIDVKPSNMLVNSNGNIKICDFGVSIQVGLRIYCLFLFVYNVSSDNELVITCL